MGVVISFPVCWFRKQLEELEEAHMLRGQLKASQQLTLLSSHEDLAQALEEAFFVQVNAPPPPMHVSLIKISTVSSKLD